MATVVQLRSIACAAARRAGNSPATGTFGRSRGGGGCFAQAHRHHGAAPTWRLPSSAPYGTARVCAVGAGAVSSRRQGLRQVSCAAASSSISMEDRAAAIKGVEAAALAWSAAVSSLSVPDVVGLYAPDDAVLLGTVDTADDGIRIGKEKITTYFDGFLNKEKISPLFPKFNEADVLVLSADCAIYNGYYTFELTPKSSTESNAGGSDGKPSRNRRGFLSKLLFWRSSSNSDEGGSGSGMKIAKAKFSFLYRRDDSGAWKIVTHNSGFTPEGLLDG